MSRGNLDFIADSQYPQGQLTMIFFIKSIKNISENERRIICYQIIKMI